MIKQIAHDEAARRRPLFDAAKNMLEPVITLIQSAIAAGAEISLRLDPPNRRSSNHIYGSLRCRSFHAGVGTRLRRYDLDISPAEKCCEVWLHISQNDAERYEWEYRQAPERDLHWACTYRLDDPQCSIVHLKEEIEEALITQLAEREGGLDRLRLSNKPER